MSTEDFDASIASVRGRSSGGSSAGSSGARVAELIGALRLDPHPEGGYYREIHRSASSVEPRDGRTDRAALTTIYFLLVAGAPTRWHRVASDEAWHFHEGDPLELFVADPEFERAGAMMLGRYGADAEPIRIVRAGAWQAARTTGEYTLVGCTVGPGFDFEDFQMLRHLPNVAQTVRSRHPHLATYI